MLVYRYLFLLKNAGAGHFINMEGKLCYEKLTAWRALTEQSAAQALLLRVKEPVDAGMSTLTSTPILTKNISTQMRSPAPVATTTLTKNIPTRMRNTAPVSMSILTKNLPTRTEKTAAAATTILTKNLPTPMMRLAPAAAVIPTSTGRPTATRSAMP